MLRPRSRVMGFPAAKGDLTDERFLTAARKTQGSLDDWSGSPWWRVRAEHAAEPGDLAEDFSSPRPQRTRVTDGTPNGFFGIGMAYMLAKALANPVMSLYGAACPKF